MDKPAWTQQQYRASGVVQDFALWIGGAFKEGSLRHVYTPPRSQESWQCTSLLDAVDNYCWPMRGASWKSRPDSDFEANHRRLRQLQSDLRGAFASGDADRCLSACVGIMKWGGTTNSNRAWLRARHADGTLLSYLQRTRAALGKVGLPLDATETERIRSNAGFTKIHSLLVDDFIIYDSRVAAALTWFIRAFCERERMVSVPQQLAFCTMPSKAKRSRNATKGQYVFPAVTSQSQHLRCNLMANWLCIEILERNRRLSVHADRSQELRRLEAALFMIGYDLTGLRSNFKNHTSQEPE